MEKEFMIDAFIEVAGKLTADTVCDMFVEFIELNKWYCGGGFKPVNDDKEVKISVGVSVEDELTYDQFYTKFTTFFESVGWAYKCEVVEVIDGYYINQDGIRGSHVMGDDYVENGSSNKVKRRIIALGASVALIVAVCLGSFAFLKESDGFVAGDAKASRL